MTTGLLAVALLRWTLAGDGLLARALVVLAWGVAFGMVPGAATGWMLNALPEAPEAGQAMLKAFQVAIASGAILGGRSVDGSGITSAMLVGAALVAGAMLAAATLGRGDRAARGAVRRYE